MSKRRGPAPFEHKSRQHIEGGGKFQSEAQRKFLWAVAPKAARKWAHNLTTTKPDWGGTKRTGRGRK